MVRIVYYNNMASGKDDPMGEALKRATKCTGFCEVCCGARGCIFEKYMKTIVEFVVMKEMKSKMGDGIGLEKAQLRYLAYRQMNELIPGNGSRKKRVLPNCVIAGIRGLVYEEPPKIDENTQVVVVEHPVYPYAEG